MVPFSTATVTLPGTTRPGVAVAAVVAALAGVTAVAAVSGRAIARRCPAAVVLEAWLSPYTAAAADDQDAGHDEHEITRAGQQAAVPGRPALRRDDRGLLRHRARRKHRAHRRTLAAPCRGNRRRAGGTASRGRGGAAGTTWDRGRPRHGGRPGLGGRSGWRVRGSGLAAEPAAAAASSGFASAPSGPSGLAAGVAGAAGPSAPPGLAPGVAVPPARCRPWLGLPASPARRVLPLRPPRCPESQASWRRPASRQELPEPGWMPPPARPPLPAPRASRPPALPPAWAGFACVAVAAPAPAEAAAAAGTPGLAAG